MTETTFSIFSLKVLVVLTVALALSGCASDYRAVREGDLSDIKAQLQDTERSVIELEQKQTASRDLLLAAEQESLQRLLTAIKDQDEARECPVVEQRASCPPARAERNNAPAAAKAIADDKLVIGEIENLYLDPPGAIYEARIDTGADTASLDAREVQTFERDGEDWVRFKMPLPGRKELIEIEREVSRFARILQSSTDDSERRPVVKMRVMIGSVERLAEFTLTNREHLEFPVLIGRNVLKDSMVVDVSRARSVSLPDELRNSDAASE